MGSSGAFRAARQAASESAQLGPMLSITLVRSVIGRPGDQGRTVEALGLRRMHQTVIRPDHPSIRGMVEKVSHLVRVEEIAQPGPSPS